MSEQVTEAMVLRKSITVKASPESAFALYTDGIATWWPMETHSSGKEKVETVVFEGRVGGRFFERHHDGTEILWGTVVEWDPPNRLVYTWHPDRGAETAQEVEMRFIPDGEGTRVELEHRGWDKLGDRVAKMFADYDTGWDYVLGERYASAA